MDGRSNEKIPGLKSVSKPVLRKKDHQINENADVLGVCLVGSKSSRGSFEEICSGSVVKGLPGYNNEIFVITSANIAPNEKETDENFKKKDYYLYFKEKESPRNPAAIKTYKLHKVTKSEKMRLPSGLAIIPLDAEQLSKASGLKTYRPFQARNVTDLKSLNGLICQIVKGTTRAFDVKSYNLVCNNNEYVLKLPKGTEFHSLSDLTAKGAVTDLHPYGAIILNNGAVGVLNFVGDKISPVLLSQLSEFGNVSNATTTKAVDLKHNFTQTECEDLDVAEAAPQNQVPRSSEAAEAAAPGPSAALQHQAPSPEAAAAAAPGPSAALLNQAPPPKPTREVMPEHNAASLLNQTSPPELSGATVPSPLNQALSPREEAAAAVPVGRGVAEQNWNTDSKFVNNITGTKNVLIGDNITATIGSSSTDAASQHQAPPPNTAAATVPGPSVPQAGPKFFNNIQRADNVMIGDHIKATIGVSSTDAAATQHQAPPQPPGGTAPRVAAPGAAAPRTRSVPQAVPKFLNNIQCTGNIMVGDYIKATIGTSSIDAAATQHQAPPQPPGGTAPRAAAPRTRSVRSGNCAPTPAKFNNNIQGAGTVVTGDHATINIVSSSRRGAPASNART